LQDKCETRQYKHPSPQLACFHRFRPDGLTIVRVDLTDKDVNPIETV
jgi:hypothetical protein